MFLRNSSSGQEKEGRWVEVFFFLPLIFIKGADLHTAHRRERSGERCPPHIASRGGAGQEKMATIVWVQPKTTILYEIAP